MKEIQKLYALSNKNDYIEPLNIKQPKVFENMLKNIKANDKIAIDKSIECVKPKFGNNKVVITWHYNGSDSKQHEIILKYYLKIDKHQKSKRVIIVDGEERYSKKSKDVNFVLKKCADNVQLTISRNKDDDVVSYELFINGISFSDLLLSQHQQQQHQHQRMVSFSL